MSSASDPVDPPQSDRRTGGFWVMIGFAILAFLAIAWSIGWVLLSINLRASIDNWMDFRRAVGDRLTHGDRVLDGYPFQIRFSYADVAWVRVDGDRRLIASTDRLVVSARPWRPFRLRLGSPGPVAAAWQAPSLDVSLTATSAEGVVGTTPRAIDALELDLREVVAADRGRRVIARAKRLALDADPTPATAPDETGVSTTLRVSLLAEALEPTDILTPRLPFEGPADGRLKAVVRGPLPLSLDPASLALWRDSGGVIDVDHLGLSWRPMDLTAEGTLTLDGLMRPEGAATAEIRGLPAMIDRAVSQGLLAEDMATLLRLATAAFSRTTGDGGAPAVRAPVTIQDGRLAVGPIKILRVPSLVR